MDDLERIHQKDELKKWIRSLSHEDLQEYKRKYKSRKEVQYRIEKTLKRIDKAIEDKNYVSVEEEKEFLEQIFHTYDKKATAIFDWLPSSPKKFYRLVYDRHFRDFYYDSKAKIRKFLIQQPSSPSFPTILHTMTAILRYENSLSPETKTMLQSYKEGQSVA